MSHNVLNIGVKNWWKGYQLIVLDAIPVEIPSAFLEVLFSRCQRLGVSLELCVFSGADKSRLSIALIIRYEDASRYNVQGTLDDYAQSLLAQLAENGFCAHIAQVNDPVTLHLDTFFSGAQSLRNSGKGFFPEDKLISTNQFYVPGRYSPEKLLPISWEKLAHILTRYPMSMMCIQLINTALSAAEHQHLKNCVDYFYSINSQYPSVPNLDRQAINEARLTYEQLFALAEEPLFFVNCFCVGDVRFTDDMNAQMRTWNYRTFSLDPQMLQQGHYLFFGDRITKAEIYGHMEKCIRRFQPNSGSQRLSHLITSTDAATLFPLPLQAGKIPGVKFNTAQTSHVLIPKESVYQENSNMVFLGNQDGTGTQLGVSLDDFRRHGFITGKSGCGKTTFAMGLLYQLNKLRIPFLVIEPAKLEYRSLLSVIDDLKIYSPGLSSVSPVQLNLFLPPKGVTQEEYLPALISIFNAAIAMDHPLDVIIPQVIQDCYNQYGWRPGSTQDSKGAQPFGMREFIRCYQDYIRKYYADNQEARSNLESGGVVRLTQLISEYPSLFDTNNTLDYDELLKHPTIIELDAISNDTQRSLIMMTILMQAKLAIKKSSVMDSPLRHVILIDEAHLLLDNSSSSVDGKVNSTSHCIQALQDSIKIFRSYGTGVFFSDQSPEKLTRDIMEHVNLKLMFQQDSPTSRAILAAMTRMDSTMQNNMIDLAPGQGYIFLDNGFSKPASISTPNYKHLLKLPNKISDHKIADLMRTEITAPFSQCASCESCANRCNNNLRADANFIASRLLNNDALTDILATSDKSHSFFSSYTAADSTKAQTQFNALQSYFQEKFIEDVNACLEEQDIKWSNLQQVLDCVKIHMIRSLLLNNRCDIKPYDLCKLLESTATPAQ